MATENKQRKKNNGKILDCIFIAVLVLIPFVHISFGVEFTDTGYSLGNFENLQNMNLTWTIATFWANIIGQLFTHFPMGHTWIGMKIYTVLIPIITSVASYIFLKKYIPRTIVFAGEVFALLLCWCPTTILYNYLTYLLFTAAAIILAISLKKESKWGMFAAGIVLATNVFVRFPNVTETALIVVVWLDALIKRRKFKDGFFNTMVCILGFLCGIGLNGAVIGLMYGFSSIPEMIFSLFAMTDSNSNYKPTAMITQMFDSYLRYFKAYIIIVGITVVCFAFNAILRSKVLRMATVVGQVLLYILFVVWAARNHVFFFNYEDYYSMHFWVVCFLILGNIFAVWALLRKRTSYEGKILAMTSLVIIWITPLGSNNALFPTMNNLFIVAPVTVYLIWNELIAGRNAYEVFDLENKNSMISTRITVSLLLLCVAVQCAIFGFVFIFRDPGFPYKNHTAITGNEVLKGMHTSAERANQIEELTAFVKENGYENSQAIFFGDIPGLEYILKMPCAISHTWPDLGSFAYDDFEKDINGLDSNPIIFVNANYFDENATLPEDLKEKQLLLARYMEEKGYVLRITSGNVSVYTLN